MSNLEVTDLFCGAGGSSTGMKAIPGVKIRYASNHWKLATETHQQNHPEADHDCADISQVDPRRYPRTDILWASPECFAAGTLILTEHGLTPIEEIVVGDRVLTHHGRYRPVEHVMSREANTLRLIGQGLSCGLEATGEHPILTTTDDSRPDWTKVSDIHLGTTRWATPITYPDATVPPINGRRPLHVENPKLAWLIGRWLGDGSLRVRNGRSCETFITCGKHEADDLEQRLTWTHHKCDTCAPELIWSRRELPTAYIYANSHTDFARWLKEHFGQHSHGKTIPAWVLGAPEKWRRALLDGYLSADGYNDGRGWKAASVSKRLALGIRLLAESLGHRVSLSYHHRDTWRIEGRAGRARPQWTVYWLHDIVRTTKKTATVVDGYSWGSIKDIEPAHESVTVYDLTVADDHSYIADGIVVHNCTNHSKAKGRKRLTNQPDLFGETLPKEAEERSRATMWDVVRFSEVHKYEAVQIENVVDVYHWPPFDAWLAAMRSLGYRHQLVFLNSMHANQLGLPAPQSRDRIYILFHREGNKAPDLNKWQRPIAYCPTCDELVHAIQSWKNPDKPWGRYRQQYVYRCPKVTCRNNIVEPAWLPASAAIDWSMPGMRIGDRDKPLSDKTLARIQAGIERYWTPIHLEAAGHTYDAADPKHPQHGTGAGYMRAWPVTDPLKTIHTVESKAVAIPPLLIPVEGRDGKQALPATHPLRTQTTRAETATVFPPDSSIYVAPNSSGKPLPPFIAELRGGGSTARDTRDPLATITAGGNHHGLVIPSGGTWNTDAKPTDEPHRTMTTHDSYALIQRHNSGGAEMVTPVHEPVRTLTTGGHQSLLQGPAFDIDDVHFRMLEPHEINAAMAFPDNYIMLGTRRERVRMAGNAVTPPAARDLMAAVSEAITGEELEPYQYDYDPTPAPHIPVGMTA